MARHADSRRIMIGLVFATLAMLSFVTAGLLANHLVGRGASPVVVAFYEALFGLSFTLGIKARALSGGGLPGRGLKKSFPSPGRPLAGSTLAWMLTAGVLFALATGSFYTALSRIDFSVAAPITGAVPLVSYLFVLVMLRGHERLTSRVVFGAALVVAGVGLIGVAN